MNSQDPPLSGSRRIYNQGAHLGITQNSLNQRMIDGFDFNASGKHYDQHFDSQMSHEHSVENYSSRQQYNTGTNDLNLLNQSSHQLKRSETEQIKTNNQVTFAQTGQPRNHPMHIKGSNSISKLERIEENKSRTPSRGRQPSHKENTLSQQKGQNINDISQLTVNSNRLEDSIKAPGRPPIIIPQLTEFLIKQHQNRYGVLTKDQKELHRFWKEQVSSVYRHKRQANIQNKSIQANQQDKSMSLTDIRPQSSKKFITSDHSTLGQYKKFEKLFEMDVAYTLQEEIEKGIDDDLQATVKKETQTKAAQIKRIKDKQEAIIKWMVTEYYNEYLEYQLTNIGSKVKEEYHLKRWHKYAAEKQLKTKAQSENSKKHAEKVTAAQKKPLDSVISAESKPIVEDKKVDESKPVEEKKIEEDQIIKKAINQEMQFMTKLFLMLNEKNLLDSTASGMSRIYRDCKEKGQHGIVWARGDDDADRVIFRFFKPECILARILMIYEHKCKTEGRFKFNHLSLFGFYLKIEQSSRILYLIDWPLNKISSEEVVTSKINEEDPISQLKQVDLLVKDEEYSKLTMERLLIQYELYVKLIVRTRNDEVEKSRHQQSLKDRENLLVQVFGKDKKLKIEQSLASKKTKQRISELAIPKDKWKRLKILMDLKKKFSHDITLQKMIKEELKANKVFKFPEEYDLYDNEENNLCKHMGEVGIKTKDLAAGQTIREKFKVLDDQDLYYLKREINASRRKEKELDEFLVGHAIQYLHNKKKRLQGELTTVRLFVSKLYHEMVEKFPEISKQRFPHISYGTIENSAAYKKSYPQKFKEYFFRLVKSYFKQQKGLIRKRNPPPSFMIPGGKRCLIHSGQECPEECTYATFNQKVVLRSAATRRMFKDPNTYRSRVWRRKDFKNALDKVLMLNSEQANCTFEPEAGSMSRTIDIALKANPNLRKDGLIDEGDPEGFVKKLGSNFEKSHPEVYKAGVLKRALLMFKEGKFEDALKRLYDGFNVESIKKHFDPYYMRRFFAEALIKAKNDRQSKERSQQEPVGLSSLNRVQSLIDQPDSQKKKPEEDFENKKLKAIFKEAFDLISTIEERKKAAELKIDKIQRNQRSLKKSMRSFSTYKRSQSRADMTKGEHILFRSIMCPLKEKCPRDQRPRWPTSNTKSNTKFGDDCPYAHHQMELKFPESIVTKLSSSYQTIKNMRSKVDFDKPREAFKPSGPLFDCSGCNSKSSKHIGGPCNLCRYKEMANKSSEKFVDKKRMESLRRSMEKRESADVKEDQKEMHKIMKELNLDTNYTIKFGLLKKACVLYFYGRFNDSFDEVAKAAKIIQDQREVEKQKQYVIEKRWKFKLGMDDGFEFPMPIEQIDPSKVDEKFLKKLDLQGVDVSTLKLYIEQVAPQSREEYSKHHYLNKLVESFYLKCEGDLQDKQNTIAKMKKQVEKLDEEADLAEAFGTGSPSGSPSKGGNNASMRSKSKKVKMCQNMLDTGKCSLPSSKCPYAHNAIQLDLIPVETKMKNLQGVIQSQTQKMKNMKPLEPWRPVKSGEIIHTHLMDMSSKAKKKKGDGEDDDEKERKEIKRKSIFDRENIFKKPYEVNE